MSASDSSCPPAEHLRAALDGCAQGVMTFDGQLALQHVSARLHAMLGTSRQTAGVAGFLATGASLPPHTRLVIEGACQSCIDRGIDSTASFEMDTPEQKRVVALRVTPLADGHFLAAFEDVTDRDAAEAKAIEHAMRDPLTGLLSRQLFENRVTSALAGAGGVGPAVLLIDLDRFKAVNDTLGHPIGDLLLGLVAKRLRAMLRAADVLARLGGDEFALLIPPGAGAPTPETMARTVEKLARRIVDILGRPYLINGHLVNVGASVGVAIAPGDGAAPMTLMRSADLALYDAKNAGRSTYSLFRPELDSRALARRALEIDLRKALALNEFELFYQPQIDLETDTVVGFEALLRWRHPERGLVPPNDFIPLAEEIGLIVPLGEWVLNKACREAARWPATVSVAVNVSPHQFEDTSRLTGVVARALAQSGLPGERLEIEITESVLLRNEAAVLAALHGLRTMRVRVAMDDFGTGYSSLSQLHSFPFDKIKIDRSFVKDRGDVSGQNAIIRAITALGVSLGMSTIAEGVETSEQLDRIRAEGCTSVQGYLFSRPVPVEEVGPLIASLSHPPALLPKEIPA